MSIDEVGLHATPTEKRLSGYINQALDYIETVERENTNGGISEPEPAHSRLQMSTLRRLLTGSGECG